MVSGSDGPRSGGKRGRGAPGKVPVVIAVETPENIPRWGRARMSVVEHADAAHLIPFLREAVEPGSTLRTDAHRGYNAAMAAGYQREAVAIAAGDHPAHSLLPAVHRVASLFKRWLHSTHQGAVRAEHLQSYLEEYAFRFNRRHAKHGGLRFYRLLEQLVATGPVPRERARYGYWRPPVPEPAGSGPTTVIRLDTRTERHRVGGVFLRSDLLADGRFTLLTWTSSAATAKQQTGLFRPNVVIVDASHLGDVELLRKLRSVAPDAKLIVHDRWGLTTAADATALGADAYDASDLHDHRSLRHESTLPHIRYYMSHKM